MDSNTNEMYEFIMPVYNEADIIESQVHELFEFLDSLDINYKLRIMENGSEDGTVEILEGLDSELDSLVVHQSDSPNVGRAKQEGLLEAEENRCFIIHADLWDKEFIIGAINLLEDFDLIQSSKVMEGANDNRPLKRNILTWGYTTLLRYLVGFRGTDTRGLKALRRDRLIAVIQKCKTERGMFETELVIRAQKENFSIKELPISVDQKRQPRNFMIKKITQNVVDILKLTWIINREY